MNDPVLWFGVVAFVAVGFIVAHQCVEADRLRAINRDYSNGKEKEMIVNFAMFRCSVKRRHYDNGRVALVLLDAVTGSSVAVGTVNLPDEPAVEDEVFVKTYGENKGMLRALVDAGIVAEPHRDVVEHYPNNAIKIPVCRLLPEQSFGVDPHKLHRAGAPDTSVAAAYSIDTASVERKVLAHFKAALPGGLTIKELEPLMGKARNTFSGRVSGLLDRGLIEDGGERRDGCRVNKWVADHG